MSRPPEQPRLALLNRERPTQKALQDARSLIEVDLVYSPDSKRDSELVPNLLIRNHRWPRSMGLTRVARQDQAPGSSAWVIFLPKQFPWSRHLLASN
jgi:hypothetical protein